MNHEISPLALIAVLLRVATSALYPSIQWVPTNPLFSQNKTQCVYPMSKVIFVCPNPAMVVGIQQDGTAKERMYENLWLVDKPSYDQCKVNVSNPRVTKLLECANPLQLMYHTAVFQKFSAAGGGPEYTPGKEYYYIATSDGTQLSLKDTSGGHCKTKNMRLEFHVCHSETDAHCESPDKCNIREKPTKASPTTVQKSHTGQTGRAVMITPNPTKRTTTPNSTKKTGNVMTTPNQTKKTGNNSKKTGNNTTPRNPVEGITNTTKYHVAIGILAALNLVLLPTTSYLFYRLRVKKQTRKRDHAHLREKLSTAQL